MHHPKLVLLLLCAGLDPGGATSATPTWESVGPQGALPVDLEFAADGQLVWLATDSPYQSRQLYSSRDQGTQFHIVDLSAVCGEGTFSDLEPDPENPQVALLACGSKLLRTTDSGSSWESIHDGAYALSLTITPTGTIFFVGPTASGLSLHRLDRDTGTAEIVLRDLWVTPITVGANGTLWAVTYPGGHFESPGALQRSLDNGLSWQVVNERLDEDLAWIVADPVAADRLWFARYEEPGRVQQSLDGGLTFRAVGPLYPSRRWPLSVAPTSPPAFFLGGARTANARIRLLRSDEGLSQWRAISSLPAGTFIGQRVSPADPQVALAVSGSFESLGILRTLNGGLTWSRVGGGLAAVPITDVAIQADQQGTLWSVVDGQFLYRREGHWRSRGPLRVASVTADPRRVGRLWISADARVWRTDNSGRSWQDLGAVGAKPLQLESHPSPLAGGVLFAVPISTIYPQGRLLRSANRGESWTRTGTNLDQIWRIAARNAQHLGLTGVVCSFSRSCDGTAVALESVNGGRSWSRIDAPGDELAFAWSPNDSNVALLATTEGLFRRDHRGAPWIQVGSESSYRDLVASHTTLYALRGSTVGSVWSSTDDGNTWRALGEAFEPGQLPPHKLEIRAGTPDRVFAQTWTSLFEYKP